PRGYGDARAGALRPAVSPAPGSARRPPHPHPFLAGRPPLWEAFRRIMYLRMGDPGTPEGRKLLSEESPLNSATRIRAPLMVVQGANDPRVNKRESDQIVIAARDHGVPVEYLVAPDEGHGFARPVNNLAMV